MRIAFNPSTVAALTTPPNNKDITFDLRGRNIFARGVKFYGTDTNTWRDIKINNVSIGSHTLDLRNGSNTTLTNTNGVVTINSTWRPVVDNLTSDSTTSSLSAKQGKVLKALIDGKSNSGHTHDDRYVKKSGDTMSGVLTIDTTTFGALTIKRNDDVNGASIQFRGKSNIYGYIGFNAANRNKQLLRWNGAGSQVYTILDTSSTYTSGGKGVINGTTITQVDNADKLDGYHADKYIMVPTTIDASALDASTYYPVTIWLPTKNTRIEVEVSLDSGTKPSWSTHNSGFTTRKVWESNGSGWGTTSIERNIFVSVYSFASEDPVRGIGQLTNSSIEYVYVRGGGKYFFKISVGGGKPTLQKAKYTTNNQSVAPTKTAPALITPCINTPHKNVTLWGQNFNGNNNVSGSLSGVAHIQFSANNAYDIGSNSNASRYIYTHWLGSKSGANLRLAANNSDNQIVLHTNGNVGIGTNSPSYKLQVNGDIHISHSTNNNMSYNTSNPRIVFSENGGQAVGLVYTDWDGYRASKGLKVMDVDNSDTGNVWLEVQGYNYSSGYVKNGSSNSYVLLGGGDHKTESSLRVAYASSATSATRVIVNQHTSNDINYPLVWSSQPNNSSVTENQLFKSWADLYYNPKNRRLYTNRYVGSYANLTQTSMRHIDADLNSKNTDHTLYIGYGAQTYTAGTNIYASTGSGDTTNARYLLAQFNTSAGINLNGNINTRPSIIFRSEPSYKTTLSYFTSGNEALCFETKSAITSIIFHNGATYTASASHWYDLVNGVQIKNNCLAIGAGWANGVNPDYKLKVGGNSYFAGHLIANNTPSSWLDGQRYNQAGYNLQDVSGTGVYYPWMRQTNTGSAKWFSIGILNNSFYILGSKTSRTENSYDYAWRFDLSNGWAYGNFSNADTTDGVHITWSGTNDNPTYLASWDNNGKAIRAATRSNITVGNADKLDGYHESSFLRYRSATNTNQEATLWNQIGIKEYDNALPDNLHGVYNFGSVISLPSANSRFEIYTSHQASIGNGLYYRSGWGSDKKTWLKFIDSSNIGSQSVNYANSAGSASSADKTRALKYTGTGSSEITAHQTAASYMGRSGWASYIICNHGDGSKYYSQTIAFPFWSSPIYRRLEGGTDRGWKKFYTEENPPSWDNVTNKPSSFTPSSHTHSWASITDKIVAGNEFNIVNAGFKEGMWFNYLPINDRSKTATISSYHFGNGAKGYASIVASGFIKSGGNASQLLRANGGVAAFNWSGQAGQPTWLWGGNSQHSYYVYNPSNFRVAYATSAGNADTVDGKHASDFAPASHNHTYIVAEDLKNRYPAQILDPKRMKLSFLAASTLGIKNDGTYYDVITVRSYVDSSGGFDNALLFSKNTNSLYHTRFAFGSTDSWGSPLLIIDSGNIGSQSVAYASKAGSVAWSNVTGKPTIPNPTDYYWANIKVSTSSNTQTTPSVNTIYANNWFRSQGASGWYSESYGGGIYMSDTTWIRTFGDKPFYCNKQIYSSDSIRMGDIYLQNKNEINNGANGNLQLNYRNAGNISLCNGGGNVGIGKSIPSYKLDVNGNARMTFITLQAKDKLYYKQPICIACGYVYDGPNYASSRRTQQISCNRNAQVALLDSNGKYRVWFTDILESKYNREKMSLQVTGCPGGQDTSGTVKAAGMTGNYSGYLAINVWTSDDASINPSSFYFALWSFED